MALRAVFLWLTVSLCAALLNLNGVILGAEAAVLVDFQVAQPPPLPQTAQQCTVQILQRTFGNSFGDPEIVQFTPPTDCGEPGTWAGISLNLTVTSNGTQFDRLGIFTFQNVEIWRTSTPEPVSGDGIIWTYLKDVTRYIPLFENSGTFIFELDNLLETGLDGQYAATVSATFFASSATIPPAPRADLIVPISTLSNTSADDASVPPGFSLNVTLPINAVTAFAELYASGNGDEEFWYFNVANEFIDDLPNGTTLGQGPFREVRVLVDGMVAGVAFPYAVIFTGGIVPTAWRPITSYGALDLPTYFLDLTPFIPILTDGSSHNITLDVASAEADHTINQNWFVSGLLQVQLDSSSLQTTGNMTIHQANDFADSSTTGAVSPDGLDLNVTVTASRSVRIESTIVSGNGTVNDVVFTQELQYSNLQEYINNATIQLVTQTSAGQVSSTHNGVQVMQDSFSFPLFVNFTILTPDGDNFTAFINHSYDRTALPSPFILGSTITENQFSSGFFHTASTGNSGTNGTSNNTFTYVDTAGNTFDREVDALLDVITFDHQGGSLAPFSPPSQVTPLATSEFGVVRLPGGKVIVGGQ